MAIILFRAQKNSGRAKVYRGGIQAILAPAGSAYSPGYDPVGTVGRLVGVDVAAQDLNSMFSLSGISAQSVKLNMAAKVVIVKESNV